MDQTTTKHAYGESMKNKNILITGGSGFLGDKLIERLYPDNNIRVIARNEGNLIYLKEKYKDIDLYIGDIQDMFTVKQACKDMDNIFHLAASKHVGLAEKFVKECVQTNTIGSLNILEETLNNDKIECVLGISTDKAAQVNGVYGASKLLMEKLFEQYGALNDACAYRIVRYGNVLYSTGSVLCKWRELLKKGEQIIITDPTATRFFWTVDSAVDLIFECLDNSNSAEPYVPEMKSMSIGDLLEAMANKYLPEGKKLRVRTIGLQPGENLHEKVHTDGRDSSQVEKFTISEIMELI